MANGITKETFEGMEPGSQASVLFDLQHETLSYLKGDDNKPGLCTRIALTEVSLSRLWKWVAVVSLAIFVWAINGG